MTEPGAAPASLKEEVGAIMPAKTISRLNAIERESLARTLAILIKEEEEETGEDFNIIDPRVMSDVEKRVEKFAGREVSLSGSVILKIDFFLEGLNLLPDSFSGNTFKDIIESWGLDSPRDVIYGLQSRYSFEEREALFDLGKLAFVIAGGAHDSDVLKFEGYVADNFRRAQRMSRVGGVESLYPPIPVKGPLIPTIFDPEQGLESSAGFTNPFHLPGGGIKTIAFVVAGKSSLKNSGHQTLSVMAHEMIHQNQNRELAGNIPLVEGLTEGLSYLRMESPAPPYFTYRRFVVALFKTLNRIGIPHEQFLPVIDRLNQMTPREVFAYLDHKGTSGSEDLFEKALQETPEKPSRRDIAFVEKVFASCLAGSDQGARRSFLTNAS